MSRSEIDQQVAALLAGCRTATVATVDEHDRPHAANVQYVHDDRSRLYFVSNPDSAHARHIARTGHVAVTVYAHQDQRPNDIHGLQLRGACQLLDDPKDRQYAHNLYLTKYPFVAETTELLHAVEAEQFYRVTPTWIRWIDNREQFGFKVEMRVSSADST